MAKKESRFSLLKLGSYLFSVVLFPLVGIASYFFAWVNLPLVSNAPESILFVQNGWGLNRIAVELESKHIIKQSFLFKVLALYESKLESKTVVIQSGEYVLSASMSPKQILQKILKGEVLLHKITLPEGMTSIQFSEMLNNNELLSGDLVDTAEEGSLLPETYTFTRGYDRKKLWSIAQKDMADLLDRAWDSRADRILKSKQEVIILASIVEKETSIDRERPLVAAVFLNRLKLGMPLQADPTVVYGITRGRGALGRSLTRKDLLTDTPFNTYTRNGLPESPIANPGKASIMAVMNPAPVDYLYFVADGSGGHVFASNLAEHNKNHAKWRQIRETCGR